MSLACRGCAVCSSSSNRPRAVRWIATRASPSAPPFAAPQHGAGMADVAPQQLWQRIQETYNRARQSGSAKATESVVELFDDRDYQLQYVLRILANLAEKKATKPKLDDATETPAKGFRNPFLPYEEELWVQHMSDTHTLLLNKFSIIDHHVLVVTRQFESQQDPLNAQDLEATWQVMQAMPMGGLAFYNCGPLSGRSQPHKHVQVVPLPLADGQSAAPPIHAAVLAANAAPAAAAAAAAAVVQGAARAAATADGWPLQVMRLCSTPFAAFYVNLPPSGVQPQDLEAAAVELLQRCRQHVGSEKVSYNVVLTRSWLMYVPRGKQGVGPVDCNAMGFAGTMLVRSADELQFIKELGPTQYLAAVGVPWDAAAGRDSGDNSTVA